MTYDTIRGQFFQDPNWSRFRPTELHNFAKKCGSLREKKIPEMFNFQGFTKFEVFKKWCHQESNRGHKDFQSFALPTEL